MSISRESIKKYNIPGPRYTSYPTAPVWSDEVNESVYGEKLRSFGQSNKTLSLYIHIPFCQSLCTFCACNVVIRRQENKYGDEYLKYLFTEIELISKEIGRKPSIKQLHFGGGTPTYLNTQQLRSLFKKVQEHFDVDLSSEVAIEIDPRTIDYEKLVTLKEIGFNRISFGVQDFDQKVQEAINRIQPLAMVKEVNQWCRDLKFHSINFDLIYGLPYQTQASFSQTIKDVIKLTPDRIALYSFAYVPWLKKHQNKLSQITLPDNELKLDLFLLARDAFIENNYLSIAMDHFARKDDELAQAYNEGELYRNFMGYTVKPADEYIGLGLTSIGFIGKTFIQNVKVLPEYYKMLSENRLAVERGKILNEDDEIRQWVIRALMCQFQLRRDVFYKTFHIPFDEYFRDERDHIVWCIEEGLLLEDDKGLKVTEMGKIFVRNICMGFDQYFQKQQTKQQFSKTV